MHKKPGRLVELTPQSTRWGQGDKNSWIKVSLSSLLEQGSEMHSILRWPYGINNNLPLVAANSPCLLSSCHQLTLLLLGITLPSNNCPQALLSGESRLRHYRLLSFTQTPHTLWGNPVDFTFIVNPGLNHFSPPSLVLSQLEPWSFLTRLTNIVAWVLLGKCKSVYAILGVELNILNSYLSHLEKNIHVCICMHLYYFILI